MERQTLTAYLSDLLMVDRIKDYCPNGLQVEGRAEINRIVTGVTASQALIDTAIEQQADTLLVHHGYFWRGEAPAIVGMKKRRIAQLLKHDINLLAYHLPLDVHPQFGNNAQLAQLMGWQVDASAEPNDPACALLLGHCQATSGEQLAAQLAERLQRPLTCQVTQPTPITKLAWCSGGGQGYIDQAAALGVDAFITGEVSEQTIHSAREQGLHFFAAGHHATERYGAKALGEHLAQRFGVNVQFIDIDNPA
ncbi:Nif3-like dinuclear metal center hexameric protein [Idiomarina xiamenensis]|uniref:GTP cyclohydrolase 1 type 2 homolog n=1 Tax=Idiomarina xiamenensis 10-D-4 TaxID=740709 RepID=K2KJN1_9GAMM|nr:Nif3-like dinuclear metal center hexameric protein [Idiomarina xiamenensis]EKE86912.1 NIF3 family protein [Idiomarina xiamenensis 10-D-4]